MQSKFILVKAIMVMKKLVFLTTLLSLIFLSTSVIAAIPPNDKYGLNVNFSDPSGWSSDIASIFAGSGAKWIRGNIPTLEHKKIIMLLTQEDHFGYKRGTYWDQIFSDFINNNYTNVINYNYFFQNFNGWGQYCDGLDEASISGIANWWYGKGFITGPYIDVGESINTTARSRFSDSILYCDDVVSGLCNMNLDPSKSWFKYLKSCALKLINITTNNGARTLNGEKITGLSIDRSDVVGSGGTQQDMYLQQLLDNITSNASITWGVKVKFVGNSFLPWQGETVKRFWFIGSDGVQAEDTQIDNLLNWIRTYSNLSQYTEKHIFYMAPWLQEYCTPTQVCPPEHFVQEYRNILNYTYFTFFQDDITLVYPYWESYYPLIAGTHNDIDPNLYYDYSKFIPNLTIAKNNGFKTTMVLWHPKDWSGSFNNLVEYKDYVNATVMQLKDLVDAYEIWSEPLNYLSGWYHSDVPDKSDLPGKYYQMLSTAYQTIKAIKPNALVVGAGTVISYNYDEYWFNSALKNLGGKNYMNASSFHLYDKPEWTPEEPAWSDRAISDMKSRLVSARDLFLLPLWATEAGSSDWHGDQSVTMNKVFRSLNEVSASKIFWYASMDDAALSASAEGHYGLVSASLAPKTSFYNFEIWTVGGYCDNLKKRIYQAAVSYCTNPKWDFIADVNKDRAIDIRDLSLWAFNRYDESWCYGKLNDNVDACIYCVDTDGDSYGSSNIFVRGSTSGFLKSTPIYTYYNYNDTCSVGKLIEYDCDGTSYKSTTITCPSDYTCSSGRCIKPALGGCPYLRAWDGNEFKEIELLNIHAPENQDVTYTSSFSMQSINGRYEIMLHEAAYLFWDGSHINSVSLKDSTDKDCHLISAIHSKQGNVLNDLLYSDDKRVRTYPEEEIKLVYDSCSGNDFSFTIEGYNMKIPYFAMPSVILIVPFVSFVFVLLILALFLLVLLLMEKYKII